MLHLNIKKSSKTSGNKKSAVKQEKRDMNGWHSSGKVPIHAEHNQKSEDNAAVEKVLVLHATPLNHLHNRGGEAQFRANVQHPRLDVLQGTALYAQIAQHLHAVVQKSILQWKKNW